MAGILNPPEEAAACREMIHATQEQIAITESSLTGSVLDRETYLQKIGALLALRQNLKTLETIYRRRFET